MDNSLTGKHRFINWNKIFDIDESIRPAMYFQQLQCLCYHLAQAVALSLSIVDIVS